MPYDRCKDHHQTAGAQSNSGSAAKKPELYRCLLVVAPAETFDILLKVLFSRAMMEEGATAEGLRVWTKN